MELKILKEKLLGTVDELKPEIIELSQYIHSNPELMFKEYKSSKKIISLLKKHGFEIEEEVGGLKTAFKAQYSGNKPGFNIAYFAEYDALPKIGHGCGHNIIAATAVGAGIALSKYINEVGGTVTVCGTPAEEGGGGKITMLDNGVFDGIDAAMLLHPANETVINDISYSRCDLKVVYHGKASHAATYPDEGISALNAIIQLFNMVNAMRFEISNRGRIHGIITEGGTDPVIVPERASAIFTIRSFSMDYRIELTNKFYELCECIAKATNTEVEISLNELNYEDIRNNPCIENILHENFKFLNEEIFERDRRQGIGCTDMGNVSHRIPAVQSYVGLGRDLKGHTEGFTKASGDERGNRAAIVGAKALAMTGMELLYSLDKMKQVKEKFEEMRALRKCY